MMIGQLILRKSANELKAGIFLLPGTWINGHAKEDENVKIFKCISHSHQP